MERHSEGSAQADSGNFWVSRGLTTDLTPEQKMGDARDPGAQSRPSPSPARHPTLRFQPANTSGGNSGPEAGGSALEKELATHSSILAWEIPCKEEPGGLQVHGVAKESDTTERLNNNNKLNKQSFVV